VQLGFSRVRPAPLAIGPRGFACARSAPLAIGSVDSVCAYRRVAGERAIDSGTRDATLVLERRVKQDAIINVAFPWRVRLIVSLHGDETGIVRAPFVVSVASGESLAIQLSR